MGRTVTATTTVDGLTVVWRGAHTANVFLYGREVDCFTFAWEVDAPSFDDFAAALDAYLSEVDVAAMGGPVTADAVEVVRMGETTCERCGEPADEVAYATAGDLNSPRWCADCRAAVPTGVTARQIVEALHNEGWLDAVFENTGGGVYNVIFEPVCQHGTRLGSVNGSDNGEWTKGDYDTPAESVWFGAYAPNGDWLGEYDDRSDFRVEDARGAVIAVDALTYALERFCPDCATDR